jgi:hypothetical protein
MKMDLRTNIYFFKKDDGSIAKLRDCIILREFMYKRGNFTLIDKNNVYWVCVNDDKEELCSIWSRNKYKDDELMSTNDVLNLFRKEYDKNDINLELIGKFLKNPLKSTLLKVKKTRKKKCKD